MAMLRIVLLVVVCVSLLAPALCCHSDYLSDWEGGLANWNKQLSGAKDNKALRDAARARCIACLYHPEGRKGPSPNSKCVFFPGTGECKGRSKLVAKTIAPTQAPSGAILSAKAKATPMILSLACSKALHNEFNIWTVDGIVKNQKANMATLKSGGPAADKLKERLAVAAVQQCADLGKSVMNSYKPMGQTDARTLADIGGMGVDLAQILGVTTTAASTSGINAVGAVMEAGVDMYVNYKMQKALIAAAKKGYCMCLLATKNTQVYSTSDEAHLETAKKVQEAAPLEAFTVDLSALTFMKATDKVKAFCKEAGAELK